MGKKRGRKTSYELYGGQEVKVLINGKEYGIKKHKTTGNYYAMLPDNTSPSGTKQHWLRSDLDNAVTKFNALVKKINGEQEKLRTLSVNDDSIIRLYKKPKGMRSRKDIDPKEEHKVTNIVFITEQEHIQWLKKELQNPKELAKKVGVEQLAYLDKLVLQKSIKLSELLKNYRNKNKKMSKRESYHSKLFFDEFVDCIKCKTIDEITLKDIHKYEKYIHSLELAPKSKNNKINKISTVFKYNTGRYDNPQLIQIYNWTRGIERAEEDTPFTPVLMSKEDFEKLFKIANKKWKLILLLGLNCAMYPIDISRLKFNNIDMDKGTIAFKRGKKGKVLAVSKLWKRTQKALQDYLEERKNRKSDYIVLSKYGAPYKSITITEYFNTKLRKKAGVSKDVKFSHLRDTFATLAQDLDFNIEKINLVLGHINKGVNDRYAVRQASKLTANICNSVQKEFFKKIVS